MQLTACAGLPTVTRESTGKRPMSRSALLISTLALAGAVGCGGRENGTTGTASTGTSSSGSGSSGASSGASAGADASTVTERNPQCPATAPTAGDACKPILECEYGTDSHHVCTTTADCGSSDSVHFEWSVSPPAAGCGSNAPSCPASFIVLANGSPCPGVNSFCEYPEGLCRCIPCGEDAGISSMWGCGPWASTGMGCPAERPLSGDACSVPSEECSYGGYCGVEVGPTMLCQDGYWRQAGQIGACIIPQCGVPGGCGAVGGECLSESTVCAGQVATQYSCGESAAGLSCCLPSDSGSSDDGGPASAVDAPQAFAIVTMGPSAAFPGLCLSYPLDTTVMEVGQPGTSSAQPTRVTSGASAVMISCSVHPQGPSYLIDLQISQASATGSASSSLIVNGVVDPTVGATMNVSVHVPLSGGEEFVSSNCSVTFSTPGAGASPSGPPIAAGRIWAHLSCPGAQDTALPAGTGPDTCDAEADFILENCGQ